MEKIYCIHCGKVNDSSNKYCSYCHKRIKEKDRVLYDYIFDQTKDDIKDNVISTIFDKIKYFLKKYLYGIILSITVVAGIVSNIVVRNNYSEVVDAKPNFIPRAIVKYSSPNDLMEAFNNYYMSGDKDSLKLLLFDTIYPEESKTLGIDTSKMPYYNDSTIIKNISLIDDIDSFLKDNMEILYDIVDMKDIPSDELEYYSDLAVKFSQDGFDTYNAFTTFVYYNSSGAEEIYFDLEFVLIKKDDSYYIAEISYFNPDNRIETFLEKYN